ncbi:hypothetical protein [Burkholderia thailandensis]|uniref:hypothetical protein n=1 Tax=Burkholderia thailandensis TaxID=57975 RepID=UPI0018655DB9|nr:hypothetical protein [Burkholderia thailandensis]
MKITTDLLRKWQACTNGYGWFIRKFPQGAEYTDVQQALRDDNRFEDSSWLTEGAFSELLDDTSVTKDIAADAKNASDKLIETTTAIAVEVTTVDANTENDNGADYAQIGSSGNGARIGSSGNGAQIGSSGYGARIGSSGYGARIGSSGNGAQIGSSGYGAQIGSNGDDAQIGSSGNGAQIGSSGYGAQIGSSGYGARIGSSGNGAQIGSSGNGARIGADGENAVIAIAGFDAQFKIGKGASVSIAYRDGNERTRFAVGYEGENLKSGVWYRVTKAGQFEEIETGELADAA